MPRRRQHVRIPARNGLVHEGEVITTGHEAERLPHDERQVLVAWCRGPNAGTSGWVAWSIVARWVEHA